MQRKFIGILVGLLLVFVVGCKSTLDKTPPIVIGAPLSTQYLKLSVECLDKPNLQKG